MFEDGQQEAALTITIAPEIPGEEDEFFTIVLTKVRSTFFRWCASGGAC